VKTFSNPDFDACTAQEWLVTNGIGGFAASSLCGTNTRRYHGLLVAALDPPTRRTVMVSKVEELIAVDRDCQVSLSSNQYPGVVHPQGFQYLRQFERKPLPKAVFSMNGMELSKTVFMPQGSNTTVVEYVNSGKQAYQLRLTPLFVQRDYHSLMRENAYFDYWHELQGNTLKLYAHYGAPALYVSFSNGQFKSNGAWFKNLQYREEQARGLDYQEDARSVGEIEFYLKPGETQYLMFSTDPDMANRNPAELKRQELERLEELDPKTKNAFFNDLAVAADQFLVQRRSTGSATLIAGYPWFTDWGRDTMIALRGTCIALGKQEASKSIIRTFLQYIDGGMLPNRFPDQGEVPEYNTIDATFWLFVALYEYHQQFGDDDFIREVFPHLTDIIESHLRGARFNIHVTEEGLLFGGEGLVQLTWMDAKVGDYVVTPRQGCAVEINALWYNALKIYGYFSDLLNHPGETHKALSEKAAASFRKYFFNEAWYLNDVVIPGHYTDLSIRPNQIYAVSLPFSLLKPEEEKMVVAIVKKELFTPLGLRTLSPDHPDFKPKYEGDPWHRDTAYHQGTVWPFLIGEYWSAYLKVNKYSKKAKTEVLSEMKTLEDHFYDKGCLHGISEVFDGLKPNEGKGCFQQAWSVGMLLKVFVEGVGNVEIVEGRKPSVPQKIKKTLPQHDQEDVRNKMPDFRLQTLGREAVIV
jgi:predicted glycogen debranching enzyme